MKKISGSLIISFGFLLLIVIFWRSLNVKAPENIMTYLGITWPLLAIVIYPLAKKLIRD